MKCLIVGGSGQFGITLSKILIKKKYQIEITTRSTKKTKKKFNKLNLKKLKISKLNILDKNQVLKIVKKNFDYIFFFAGQSSPNLSFIKSSQTIESNFIGCKNFLDCINYTKSKSKFLNSSSSEIFSDNKNKLDIKSKKGPISPYGKAKLLSFNITKKYREKYNLKLYNAIFFNTESYYREKDFLIPKICIAAINAKNNGRKTTFGNLNVIREWNWCEEQCNFLLKLISKKPQDFVLSNGKFFSGYQMLKFAFDYFKLNYKNFIKVDKKYFRKKDFNYKISNFKKNIIQQNIRWKPKIFGRKLVYSLIKYYKRNNII